MITPLKELINQLTALQEKENEEGFVCAIDIQAIRAGNGIRRPNGWTEASNGFQMNISISKPNTKVHTGVYEEIHIQS